MKSTARDAAVIAGLVLAMVLGVATQGQAAFKVLFTDLSTTLNVGCDDNAACDGSPLIDTIEFSLDLPGTPSSGHVGGTAIAGPAAIPGPAGGPFDMRLVIDPADPFSGLADGREYQLEATRTGLSSGSPLTWTGQLRGTQSKTDDTTGIAFDADPNNGEFVHPSPICTDQFHDPTFGPAAATCDSTPFSDPTLFSLTVVVHISDVTTAENDSLYTGPGTTAVPEPGTLLLLASGLAVAGLWGGRRTFGKREQ